MVKDNSYTSQDETLMMMNWHIYNDILIRPSATLGLYEISIVVSRTSSFFTYKMKDQLGPSFGYS